MSGVADVSQTDIQDVSTLVSRKLDLYMNLERTEDRFCPGGFFRTKPQMQKYDFLYHVLDSTVFDENSPRNVKKRKKNSIKGDKSNLPKTEEKMKFRPVSLHLEEHPHRVVPYRQADRLENYANQVLTSFPIDQLQMLHRHRPSNPDVPPDPEHGKVQGYTKHVGSILNTHNFINYYNREGLHCGKKDGCKRLKKLVVSPKQAKTNKKQNSTHKSTQNQEKPKKTLKFAEAESSKC